MKKSFKSLSILVSMSLTACSPSFVVTEKKIAEDVSGGLGCVNFRSQSFDVLYQSLEDESRSPDVSVLSAELRTSLNKIKVSKDQESKKQELINEVVKLFQVLNQTEEKLDRSAKRERLQTLIRLEMGNISNKFYQEKKQELEEAYSKINKLSSEFELACEVPGETPPVAQNPPLDQPSEAPPNQQQPPQSPPSPLPNVPNFPAPVLQGKLSRIMFGAKWTFATAYQSCEAIELREMDQNTQDVVGVLKTNEKHKTGPGYKRVYTSIPDIQRTHYYVRGMNYGPGCFSVKDRPLVYDFGGEPKVGAQSLNLFENAGTGTSVLGIDCSALISTAVVAGGLRYNAGLANKPIFIRQSSYDFLDPVSSGWNCFDRITMTAGASIKSGDIMAVPGHVVLIDSVATDPFGLRTVSNIKQCASISAENFDFVVMQSSPSKNSIGINRYAARDYLLEEPKMRESFERYAYYACMAKFDGKSYKPKLSGVSIIRHKGTKECLAPRITLARESCISSCRDFQ